MSFSLHPTEIIVSTITKTNRTFWIILEPPYKSRRHLTRIIQCAVKRRRFSVGAKPTRQLSLQPVAIGAVEEVTNLLKPSVQRVALGDLAKVQAVTSSER